MGLFSFFKKSDKVVSESSIDSTEVVDHVKQSDNQAKIDTQLSFHPEWNVPLEQQYVFRFLANELEPLLPNQLSLSGISIDEDPKTGSWHVRSFFRSSLSESIELGEIELLILNEKDERVASQVFNFNELGVIPPKSARPWIFTFEKANITAESKPENDNWKVAFNLISLRGHQLDLDEQWEKQLPKEQIEQLKKIVSSLPKLGKTEVNFTGLQANLQPDNSLHTSIFIRNGMDKAINLEQLPIEIIDANGNQVAKGSFKMDPVLTVQPNSSKPWTFIFPAQLVTEENPDLSRWTARVTQ